jgi:hypothetical protein
MNEQTATKEKKFKTMKRMDPLHFVHLKQRRWRGTI